MPIRRLVPALLLAVTASACADHSTWRYDSSGRALTTWEIHDLGIGDRPCITRTVFLPDLEYVPARRGACATALPIERQVDRVHVQQQQRRQAEDRRAAEIRYRDGQTKRR